MLDLDEAWKQDRLLDIAKTWERLREHYRYAWYDISPYQRWDDVTLMPAIVERELFWTSNVSGWKAEFDGKGSLIIDIPPREFEPLKGFSVVT